MNDILIAIVFIVTLAITTTATFVVAFKKEINIYEVNLHENEYKNL